MKKLFAATLLTIVAVPFLGAAPAAKQDNSQTTTTTKHKAKKHHHKKDKTQDATAPKQ